MAALGEAAVEQRPVLVDLSASARRARALLRRHRRVRRGQRGRRSARSATPRRSGREAVRAAGPEHARAAPLRRAARPTSAANLRILLEDFDDPARAVEPRPAQPGRRGLLRRRGAAPLRLQPVAHDQRLRRAGPHGARRRLHRQVLALRGRRAREGPDCECRAWLAPTSPACNVVRSGPTTRQGDQAEAATRLPAVTPTRRRPRGGRRRRAALQKLRRLLGSLPGKPDRERRPRPLLDYLLGP